MKVLMAGLMMDTNLGDELFPRCLSYIISSERNDVQYEYLDLYGRTIRCENNTSLKKDERLAGTVDLSAVRKFTVRTAGFLRRKLKIYGPGKHFIWKINPNDEKRLKEYYSEKIKESSLVIFAGGGIIECSSNHDYYHHIDLVTEIADKMNIPVYFNAVGRVYDPENKFGWKIMKNALNRKCVKGFTCRDGAEWINRNCFDGRNFAESVPCSAILASDAYNIKKSENSDVIGIGLIRGNVFTSYGKDFDETHLLKLYSDIVKKITEKGYRCCLFTNGYSKDIMFGKKLLDSLNGYEVEEKLEINDSDELMKTLAGFKGIITARLHSCIAAYSLDIPAVAISWTDKVSDFFELIGKKESAVKMENLNAGYITEKFLEELDKEYDAGIFDELSEKVKKSVHSIIREAE